MRLPQMMSKAITSEEAIELVAKRLGSTFRARHSIFVGYLMSAFASAAGDDAETWRVTGICHDLDFEATKGDRSQHGLVTAEWLEGQLPPDALLAIRAHDHRTGIVSEDRLAVALRLADALAIAEVEAGRDALLRALRGPDPARSLDVLLPQRRFLPAMILTLARRLPVPLQFAADVIETAPLQ